MIVYKLTDENMQTHDEFQWKAGKWYEIPADDRGQGLCSRSWFHVYIDPVLALFLNPIGAHFTNPRLFEAEGDGEWKNDRYLKCGCTRLKLIRELPVPTISHEQRIAFAIYCAVQVYRNPNFLQWADAWLDGSNRSADAAYAAYAADAAADAAYAAADAAHAAAYAADAAHAAAYAAYAAYAAAYAAYAAAYAADAADAAADAAAYAAADAGAILVLAAHAAADFEG